MNQLCKVCGEPAAGFHFGAFTCEGCKSFFGRTYNNISAIAGCKNSGDCVINKKNRTACKACRLRKCLLVGMSKSGSRYGRRSNWFKIHCLLQEQQTQVPTPGGAGSNSGGMSNFEQLARLHQLQARQTYQDKTNPCIKTASMSPTLGAQTLATTPTTTATSSSSNSTSQQNHQSAHPASNLFAAAKFLNGVDAPHHFKLESRLSDTPSDSGASSAGDPADDCHSSSASGRHAGARNCSSAHTPARYEDSVEEEQERRRKQLLQIFRSHSEPLKSPFAPFAITNLPPPILAGTSPAHILPALKEETKVAAAVVAPQDEPIDLSLRTGGSARSQTPRSNASSVSATSPGPAGLNELVNVIAKPAPLDLTLVRSQTLTG